MKDRIAAVFFMCVLFCCRSSPQWQLYKKESVGTVNLSGQEALVNRATDKQQPHAYIDI
jgi:hypothetical protein